MKFLTEPTHSHGKFEQTAVMLVNLGTPNAPTPQAVRAYLKEFLLDPRVVEMPRILWRVILHGAILPFRSKQSAAKYASIWTNEGSPLKRHTEKQALLLQGYLGERGHEVLVTHAMRYGSPSLPEVLQTLKQKQVERILILPAYPQYSATTTASCFDAVSAHYARVRNMPELRFIKHFHDHPGYIEALKNSVQNHWQQHGRGKLLMSFHGLPKLFLTRGDPYFCECHKTARLLAQALGLTAEDYAVSFQSRLGKAEWLQPYTAPTLEKLAREGVGRVDVICPGFIADCLETLEEIAIEGKRSFLQAGGKTFHYLPCLNEDPAWLRALAEIAEQHLIGWPTMWTVGSRDQRKQDALTCRAEAKRLGAPT